MIKFISLIILYLLVITSYFSYVIYEQTQTEIETFDLAIYEGNAVDFSGSLQMETITDIKQSGYQNWNIINNTLVYDGYYAGDVINPLVFKGIKPNPAGIYEVEYTVNNPSNLDFEIWLTKGGLAFQDSYIMEYTDSEIIMYYPYAHTTVGGFFREELTSLSMDLSGEKTIKTVVNPNSNSIQIYVNGSEIINIPAEIKSDYDSYASFRVTNSGTLTIEEIKANVLITESDENDTSFIGIISSLLILNVDEKYLPNAFNIILIKFPIIILTIAIAFYLRGVQ